jgi:hypothetical protein
MMTVDVRINGKIISRAMLINQSNLADVSDYDVKVWMEGNKELGIEDYGFEGKVEGHERAAGPWPLIARIVDLLPESNG